MHGRALRIKASAGKCISQIIMMNLALFVAKQKVQTHSEKDLQKSKVIKSSIFLLIGIRMVNLLDSFAI